MNLNTCLKYVKLFFKVAIVFYSLISFLYILNIAPYKGDENYFHLELDLIRNEGWIAAIKQNICIPFMFLVYPLTTFFKDYIALRLVSVLLTFFLLGYLYKRVDKSLVFIGLVLFYISTVNFFYRGTNDTLFNVSLIVFFVEVYRRLNNKSWNSTLAFSMLVIAFFTRSLFFIYIPVILLSFYLLKKEEAFSEFKLRIPLALFFILICFNIPSIIENKTLSYDNKVPPKNINASWTQRQYLAQLLVNEGKLPDGQHPSWEQTDNYLKKHGENSLPNGIINGVFFDLKLTIKEFFKDFLNANVYSFRQIGPTLIYAYFLIFLFIKNRAKDVKEYFVPISLFLTLGILSFIIISNVEIRWMAPLYVMAFVMYWNKEKLGFLNNKFIVFNYLVFIALSLFGMLRILNKF